MVEYAANGTKDRTEMEGVRAVVKNYFNGRPVAYFTDREGREKSIVLHGKNDVKRNDVIMVKGQAWVKI